MTRLREHQFHGDYSFKAQRGRRLCAFHSPQPPALPSSHFFSPLAVRSERAERRFLLLLLFNRRGRTQQRFHNKPPFTWKAQKQLADRELAHLDQYGICEQTHRRKQKGKQGHILDWFYSFNFCHIEVCLEVVLPETDRKKMGICSYLAVPWKSIVVLGLKLLLLVPAGVPARSGDSVLKDNITVRQGDNAVLK